jgi:hypothetical protein
MQAKTKIMVILFLTASITLSTTPVYALSGNIHPDNTHSFVGLVVFYNIDANGNKIPVSISSGILLSPTIVLTTAHSCITNSAIVCFDQGPITWSINDGQLQIEGVTSSYEGTAYVNPDFSIAEKGSLSGFIHRDVALIVLDKPVPSSVVSTYAQLPTAGLVDTLPKKSDVTLVGYGLQSASATSITRNYAYAQILSGNFAWSDEFVRCSANPGKDRGGITYGDSGGPVLVGGTNIVIAIHSYATNQNCGGVTYHARLDVTEVLDWIAEVSLIE